VTEIDPVTGLPLTEIQSAPAMRGPMPEAIPMPVVMPMAEPSLTQSAIPAAEADMPASGFLDKVTHTILGTPDSMLSSGARSEKQAKRGKAGDMAASAARSPMGAARGYMGPQSGGSGDSALESLGKIVRLFSGGGAG